MEGIRLNIRLAILFLLMGVLLVILGGRLVSMQIVNGANWQTQNESSLVRQTVLPAARGDILDRYGRPLVTNRLAYSVNISRDALMAGENRADVVLELVRAAMKTGAAYEDTLPVTGGAPFEYDYKTDSQRLRLSQYLEKKGWSTGMSAPYFMVTLRSEFGIGSEYSDEDARLIAGVLYELDMRYVFGQKPYIYIPAYCFAADVSMELVSIITERAFAGVSVVAPSVRQYGSAAAAHVLGRVGPIYPEDAEKYAALGYGPDEIVGVDGAERAFESWLHGTAGLITEEINAAGKVQNVIETIPPQAGSNVYLTIDIRFQEAVERILEAGVKELQETGTTLKGLEAEAATAVVVNVKTGELLALANYPTFSLETFSDDYAALLEDPLKPLLNRATGGTYAPGSVFKMVTASAAFEQEIITPKTRITDQGIYTFYSSPQPRCHIYPGSHGSINVSQALAVSCNYFFFDVGRQTGIDNIVKWAKLYGLGLPTGIELGSERVGYIAGRESSVILGEPWYPGNTLSAAIGQSNNQFTPIQLANYIACIADDGRLKTSHLLKEVKSYDYTHNYFESVTNIVRTLPLSEENLGALQEGMRLVAAPGGTAYSVFLGCPVQVGAKTGSAQVGDKPNNGVFTCYAPYDDPEIAVVLVVEKGGAGSRIGFIARNIIESWFEINDEMTYNPADNSLQR